MKRILLFSALVGLVAQSTLVAAQPSNASADETDPEKLKWMQGTPPPPEKQVRFEKLDHYRFPMTRWAFTNFRQMVPTANVWRGPGQPGALPYALRDDLDAVSFLPTGSNKLMSWAVSLKINYTDAILVLHKGNIVYERYFGVTKAHTPHMSFSMTKSYYGTVAAMLVKEGKLDEEELVSAYIPELSGSGFGDATVRQILDMTTGLAYSEDYTDPNADVFGIVHSIGTFPRPKDYDGPRTLYDYLKAIPKKGTHGSQFAYKSVNTDVLGWLIARVTGKNPIDLLSEKIWQKVGAEMDAYLLVDQAGTGWASGGFNAILRDHARFGEMMRRGGRFNGKQIVPQSIIKDIRNGGNKDLFAKAGHNPTGHYSSMSGWSYRNQWWVSHNDDEAFAARGIHGQTIYIDPKSELVIVRLASHPVASNRHFDKTSLPAYRAIANHLRNNAP